MQGGYIVQRVRKKDFNFAGFKVSEKNQYSGFFAKLLTENFQTSGLSGVYRGYIGGLGSTKTL